MNIEEAGIAQEECVVPASFCVCKENLQAHIDSLWINVEQQASRIRYLEKLHDTINSPWWKLTLFIIDGWPLRRVVDKPQWRPWRKWWTS